MSEPVAPKTRAVHAFPRPQGEDIPERIYETDQVITGEAVALKIQPASPVQLIAAGIIDLFLSIGVAMAALVFLSLVGSLDPEAAATYVILALVLAVVLIPAVVETVTQGRSLGRWALGVQIVRDDGGAIRFRHAIIRSLAGLFEIYMTFGSIAFIVTIANVRHKRLGDLLAGTYPVSLNSGAQLPPPLIMPLELSSWARQADVSRLPGTLAWRARQFLNTASDLEPAHREQFSRSLAAEIGPYVSPSPPPTHPERFLAAVLVIRRDTEYRNSRSTQERLRSRVSATLPYGLETPRQRNAASETSSHISR